MNNIPAPLFQVSPGQINFQTKVVRLLGPVAVPLLYAYRMAESTGHCFRLPQYFGLHRRHIPMLLALAAVVHSFELPGMFRALGGRSAGPTVYR